jgi:hypothetical protein
VSGHAAGAARRLVLLMTATATVMLVAAAVASAADDKALAEPLYFGDPVTTSVSAFDTEPGESQTIGVAAVAGACVTSMTRTEWYTLEGTGGDVTIRTAGSSVPAASSGPDDTALAVYVGAPAVTMVACNDDVVPTADRTSQVTFATDRNTLYRIQAGIVCNGTVECHPNTARGGTLVVAAINTGAPDNDLRANARPVALNSTTHQDNSAATIEPGEVRSCLQDYERFYSKTVWFKFSAPGPGQLRVHAGGPGADSVIAAYAAGSPTPLACNDDDGSGNVQSALTLTLSAGDYALQLGGFGPTVDATTADFPIAIDFTPNYDVDRDGSLSPAGGGADCDDQHAATHPGAVDVPGDGVDQNCDGHDSKDADRDGALARPDGNDCDDADGGIRPGAREIPGNAVDENCDGSKALDQVRSSLEYRYDRVCPRTRPARCAGLRLTRYDVVDVPARATVDLRCGGRGCPFERKTLLVAKRKPKLSLLGLFKHRTLRPGIVLRLAVTVRDRIGAVKTQVVGRRDLSTPKTRCLPPGAKRASSC